MLREIGAVAKLPGGPPKHRFWGSRRVEARTCRTSALSAWPNPQTRIVNAVNRDYEHSGQGRTKPSFLKAWSDGPSGPLEPSDLGFGVYRDLKGLLGSPCDLVRV